MANFFSSPQIQQTPNPEPPGYNLIRQLMLNRIMQQFTNPYGMSPGGMANWQGFNQGSKPFDPTGGFSSNPASSGGYNYLTNQGMPGMGGGSSNYQTGPQSLTNGPGPMIPPMGGGGGGQTMSGNGGGGTSVYSPGPDSLTLGQRMGANITPLGSGGSVANLIQTLLSGGRGGVGESMSGGAMPPGMQIAPTMNQQGAPVVSPNPSPRSMTASFQNMGGATIPSAPRTTFPVNPTARYDGTVMGYGGSAQPSALMGYGGTMYGAPQSHGAMPHLLGLLRMAHTQPRGAMMGGPRPGGAAMMPTPMPTHGMAMPIPMGRRR